MNAAKAKLQVVNGLAPRPRRASLMRSLYDAIASNHGPSTVRQVRALLPATDDAERWRGDVSTHRVKNSLDGGVWAGYFIRSGRRYNIAPRAYYEQRRPFVYTPKETPQHKFAIEDCAVESSGKVDPSGKPAVARAWTGGDIAVAFLLGASLGSLLVVALS